MKHVGEKQKLLLYLTDGNLMFWKDVLTAELDSTTWWNIYHRCQQFHNEWALMKKFLRNPSMPPEMRQKYLESDLWYVRLTAMLSKHVRSKYFEMALKDPDHRVRAAAISSKEDYHPLILQATIEMRGKDPRYEELINKIKLIENDTTMALLDPDPWVRNWATQKKRIENANATP